MWAQRCPLADVINERCYDYHDTGGRVYCRCWITQVSEFRVSLTEPDRSIHGMWVVVRAYPTQTPLAIGTVTIYRTSKIQFGLCFRVVIAGHHGV